jgi:hypothetical protein
MYHQVQYGNLAEWFAAVGTVAAFLIAFWQLERARKLHRKATEIAQASLVSGWISKELDGKAWVALHNESESPVYEVICCVVPFQGAGDPTGIKTPPEFRGFLSYLPKGTFYVSVDGRYRGMNFHPSILVVFTDGNGMHWLRDGFGKLKMINESATDYFKLHRPQGWELPSTTSLT